MSKISIITTSDGSHSILNTELNETYHSIHGALQESLHVFIKNGFDFAVTRQPDTPIEILEIGFGTGLNALLTLQRARNTKTSVRYTSIEAFPLDESIWSSLNYTNSVGDKHLFSRLHSAAWNTDESITENFIVHKVNGTLQGCTLNQDCFDLVYFDAFAPNKQPEMWEVDTLKKVANSMHANALFVTYCAKGQVKRDLKSLALEVETLPGPPGKKEMIRARKLSA
jgi:tRNA U34 5-methylaminomethyl-2-thiouridine-forming methyltransferase MnmC